MMNHYRVDRAHDDRKAGDLVISDDPRDAALMALGFLEYVGSDEAAVPAAGKRRKSRGVEMDPGSPGSASVRDERGHAAGDQDGPAN
jgi:hypothetical protein